MFIHNQKEDIMLPNYIWQLKGNDQSGPNVVILGGTHGDEIAGIDVIRRMLDRIGLLHNPAGIFNREDISGNLFLGFGNIEAIVRGRRAASEDRDLNRSFSGEDLNCTPNPNERIDLKRAREFVPLFRQTDFLFDIHSTSMDSVPFVCFGEMTKRHRSIVALIPVQYIITDPDLIYTKDSGLTELGTTDFFVNTYGGSAWSIRNYGAKQGLVLCYETGQDADLTRVESTIQVLSRVLEHTGIIGENFASIICAKDRMQYQIAEYYEQKIFRIVFCVKAKSKDFSYEQGMNIPWKMVKKGEIIGRYSNGEIVEIPEDGMILFQKAPKKIISGRNLFTIATEV